MPTTEHSPAKINEFPDDDFSVIDGELLDLPTDEEIVESKRSTENSDALEKPQTKNQQPNTASENQRRTILYVFAPLVFLTVALFGGLRLADGTNDFLFLRPALSCLIFAAALLILFFRARLIEFDRWFAEDFSILKNIANAAVLTSLFAASVQVFNALLPERGLPFWVVGFCFFWTLWNNLFAEFNARKLIKSLGAMFAMAFVVKYLLLANLTAPSSENWFEALLKNPTQEAFTWALDLPRFAAGTGYIQFFTLGFYLLGLYLMPSATRRNSYEN